MGGACASDDECSNDGGETVCRDNGIAVFDPVGWSYAGGKLALRARKGHHANFEYTTEQSWQKDPKEGGKPLGFRKM